MLWANRSWADVFGLDELQALQAQYGGSTRLVVVHVLSREQREGCEHGRVGASLLKRVFGGFDRTRARFLVVGTKAMKRGTFAHLRALGFRAPPLLRKRFNPLPWTWGRGQTRRAARRI